MGFLALLAAVGAPFATAAATARAALRGYVVANWLPFLLRVAPVALFAAIFAAEYGAGDVAEKWKVGALAVAAILASLDVAGKLPAIAITPPTK